MFWPRKFDTTLLLLHQKLKNYTIKFRDLYCDFIEKGKNTQFFFNLKKFGSFKKFLRQQFYHQTFETSSIPSSLAPDLTLLTETNCQTWTPSLFCHSDQLHLQKPPFSSRTIEEVSLFPSNVIQWFLSLPGYFSLLHHQSFPLNEIISISMNTYQHFCILKSMHAWSHFSHVWLFAPLWTVVCQTPLSVGFSRQEYWSGLPCRLLGDLPNPGIKLTCLKSPALTGGFFTTSTTWEVPLKCILDLNSPYSYHPISSFYERNTWKSLHLLTQFSLELILIRWLRFPSSPFFQNFPARGQQWPPHCQSRSWF